MSQEWTPPPPSATTTSVPNYLVPAIISAVCCLPIGIVGVVFAAQVNGKVAAGDIPGAMQASKFAKIFSIVAIALAVLGYGGYFLMVMLGVGLSIIGNS